jgi:hypothetical protein
MFNKNKPRNMKQAVQDITRLANDLFVANDRCRILEAERNQEIDRAKADAEHRAIFWDTLAHCKASLYCDKPGWPNAYNFTIKYNLMLFHPITDATEKEYQQIIDTRDKLFKQLEIPGGWRYGTDKMFMHEYSSVANLYDAVEDIASLNDFVTTSLNNLYLYQTMEKVSKQK